MVAVLLTPYGVMHADHTLAEYHHYLRSERGVGIGADFFSLSHRQNWVNRTGPKLYFQ